MPDYDSHSEMLEELGITDDYINASKVFVRAELVPENENVFSNIDDWKLEVDQDITPEWFDEKDCTERMRKAVKEWANTHIFIGQNDLKYAQGNYSNGRDAGWEKENYGAWLRANPPEQTTLW